MRLGSYRHDNPGVDLDIQSLALGATAVPDLMITYKRGADEACFHSAFVLDRTVAVFSTSSRPRALLPPGSALSP